MGPLKGKASIYYKAYYYVYILVCILHITRSGKSSTNQHRHLLVHRASDKMNQMSESKDAVPPNKTLKNVIICLNILIQTPDQSWHYNHNSIISYSP